VALSLIAAIRLGVLQYEVTTRGLGPNGKPRGRAGTRRTFLAGPNGEATALTQALVVRCPVGHLPRLLWDVMAARGVGLNGMVAISDQEKDPTPT
jgi:hypothetical protein